MYDIFSRVIPTENGYYCGRDNFAQLCNCWTNVFIGLIIRILEKVCNLNRLSLSVHTLVNKALLIIVIMNISSMRFWAALNPTIILCITLLPIYLLTIGYLSWLSIQPKYRCPMCLLYLAPVASWVLEWHSAMYKVHFSCCVASKTHGVEVFSIHHCWL